MKISLIWCWYIYVLYQLVKNSKNVNIVGD